MKGWKYPCILTRKAKNYYNRNEGDLSTPKGVSSSKSQINTFFRGWEIFSIMKKKLVKLIASTPIYPHWLEFKRSNELKELIISMLYGKVLEVGAGEAKLKREALSANTAISKYIATDYSGWDDAFAASAQLSQSENLIDLLHLRQARQRLDGLCSALELPYEDACFDCHVSIEVLEHIPDPYKFFGEAARVLKNSGIIVLTAPFLYGIHPDESADFFRFLPGGYRAIADKCGLTVERIVANTGVGATCAALVNQWMIRQYFRQNSGIVRRSFLLICMPFVFCSSNLLGWLVDQYKTDNRFASRFLIVLRKT